MKEFLGSVWDAKRDLQNCDWKITKLTSRCERMTASWDSGPGGKGGDPHREGPVLALMEQQKKRRKLERVLRQRERETDEFLDQMPEQDLELVLRMRYVELMRWGEIRDRLEEMNFGYTERHLYNLNKKALDAACRLWRVKKCFQKKSAS